MNKTPTFATDTVERLGCDDNLRACEHYTPSRGFKVSKEQIVALLMALRLFASGRYDEQLPAYRVRLEPVYPMHLDDPQTETLARRLREELLR